QHLILKRTAEIIERMVRRQSTHCAVTDRAEFAIPGKRQREDVLTPMLSSVTEGEIILRVELMSANVVEKVRRKVEGLEWREVAVKAGSKWRVEAKIARDVARAVEGVSEALVPEFSCLTVEADAGVPVSAMGERVVNRRAEGSLARISNM